MFSSERFEMNSLACQMQDNGCFLEAAPATKTPNPAHHHVIDSSLASVLDQGSLCLE